MARSVFYFLLVYTPLSLFGQNRDTIQILDTLPKEQTPIVKQSYPFLLTIPQFTLIKRRRLRPFQIGLALGPDIVSLSVQNKSDSASLAKIVKANSTVGFHAGLAFRLNFTRYLYFNTQPQFNFQGVTLTYDNNGLGGKTSVAPLTLEIPAHFVLKTSRYKINPACFLGIRYIGDISESNVSNPIKIKGGDLALEAGVGFEIKLGKRITLMPAIGAVIGTNNLLQQDSGNFISSTIENIKRTKIELHFVFF